MARYISVFRTILMMMISSIFVISLIFSYIQIWTRENPKYGFYYPTCEGQDTKVVRYIFDYPSHRTPNGTIVNRIESFYVRPIFNDVPDFIFRALTYNIIVPEYNNIKFTTDNCTISRFELIEIMVQQGRTGGVLIANTENGKLMCENCDSVNEVDEHKRGTAMIPYEIHNFNIILITYGIGIVVVLTFILGQFLIQFIRREWDRFVRRILSRKSFDDGVEMVRIQNYGPFMIIDDYNSNPIQNIKRYSTAATSVLFHYLIYHTVVILPFFFVLLTPRLYSTTVVLCVILFSELVYNVYGFFYYSDCKQSCPGLNSLLGHLLTITFLLNFVLTTIYILSSTLWSLLSIFIDPIKSATIIGMYFAIIYYVIATYLTFQKHRKKIKFNDEDYEKYGLEFKHLIVTIFTGLAIIFMLISWVVLSFIVINTSDTSSNIFMGMVVPLGTFATKLKQNDIINKVLHKEFTTLDGTEIDIDADAELGKLNENMSENYNSEVYEETKEIQEKDEVKEDESVQATIELVNTSIDV